MTLITRSHADLDDQMMYQMTIVKPSEATEVSNGISKARRSYEETSVQRKRKIEGNCGNVKYPQSLSKKVQTKLFGQRLSLHYQVYTDMILI